MDYAFFGGPWHSEIRSRMIFITHWNGFGSAAGGIGSISKRLLVMFDGSTTFIMQLKNFAKKMIFYEHDVT